MIAKAWPQLVGVLYIYLSLNLTESISNIHVLFKCQKGGAARVTACANFGSIDVNDSPAGKECFDSSVSKNSHNIRALFQRNIVSLPSVISLWTSQCKYFMLERNFGLFLKTFLGKQG